MSIKYYRLGEIQDGKEKFITKGSRAKCQRLHDFLSPRYPERKYVIVPVMVIRF